VANEGNGTVHFGPTSSVIFLNDTFVGNSAVYGGGIYSSVCCYFLWFYEIVCIYLLKSNYGDARYIINTTFSSNNAVSNGNDIADSSQNGHLFYSVLTVVGSQSFRFLLD
jgi:predicted outer membrane repeat protein